MWTGTLLALCALVVSVSEPVPPPEPRLLNHDPEVRYVGRQECFECHEGNATNFLRTGMARAFYPLTADRVVEDFTDDNVMVDPRSGVRYRMLRRDGKFFQQQFVLDSSGGETAVEERELTYVVGSNNHSRGYITIVDDKLFQTPVCWDPTTEDWIYCPGFEVKNEHYSREVSNSCIFCHNGRVEPVEGTRNAYHDPITHGIGCERCHGPGQLHVERHREHPDPFFEGPDSTIVNPRRLDRDERMHVCFQCHLGDSSATVRVIREDRGLQSFRPGQPLTDVLVPFRYVQQTQHDFGLVAQADRMILSRCYTESGGKMECLTCHNPHISTYEMQPGAFRDNCRTCHELDDCVATAEARGKTEPADDCVACHMRRGEAVDRKYASFTDHWIRRRIDLPRRDRRTDLELEPIFPEAFAALPKGEQHYYRARAHFLAATESPPRTHAELYGKAEESFRRAIAEGYDTAPAWFFLGKSLMFRSRWPDAYRAFSAAVERQPEHHDALFALGQSLAALGKPELAQPVFERMLELDPDDAMAWSEYGRVLWSRQRVDEALAAYRKAVPLEPWNATLHLNLGMLLAATGDWTGAAAAGDRAARLDPDSPDVWEFVANVARAAEKAEVEHEARFQLRRLSGE
ncbi:MAG: tetratricopeptide repeat protein [bacterium]|nr:tetratricopeptide repeat protein [bacterium]